MHTRSTPIVPLVGVVALLLVPSAAGAGTAATVAESSADTQVAQEAPTLTLRALRLEGRRLTVRIRATGGTITKVRVLLRTDGGQFVGRSARVNVSSTRTVNVALIRRPPAGDYRLTASGLDAAGRKVSKRITLRVKHS